jgi:hypothetical protein
MSDKMSTTIAVTLPEALYVRVQEAAKATAMSQEEVLTQSVALILPPLEADLPGKVRATLRALSLANNTKLWEVAHSTLDEERQKQLEYLADLQKERTLTAEEQARLDQLFETAEIFMLRKAEAFALLARRGYKVYAGND